jgi:hypothetical protein
MHLRIRSSPRVVTGTLLSKNKKLQQGSKIKPGLIHKLKPIKVPCTQTVHTTDTTHKSKTHVFKFLTPLTPSVEKTVSLLYRFK